MKLNLKRPIIFFDLETTGTNIMSDRIVEISIIKIWPNGKEEVKTKRINPGMPIPPEATAVHHITDDDVKDAPHFAQIAKSLADFISDSDIAGFNSIRFDIPLLAEEFNRTNVEIDLHRHRFIDVQNIYHKLEPRTLVAAYKHYCGKNLDDAHSAEADTRATYEVLLAQLEQYPDTLENDVDKLATFSMMNRNVDFAGKVVLNDKGEEIVNFGKHKGKRVVDVLVSDPGYYAWIQQSAFETDTKRVFTRIKLSMTGR